MPTVHHKQYGYSSSSEAMAAEKLKSQFEALDCDGAIFIASNVTLPGGNRIKDIDIVVAGYLKDFYLDDFMYPRNFSGYRSDKKGLIVQSFLVTIELKDFAISQIDIGESGILMGKYVSGDDKNITLQSFEQKHALRNVLNAYKKIKPYAYNIIWLEGIDKQDFEDQYGCHNEWNIVCGNVSALDFFKAIAYNGERAIYQEDSYIINSFNKYDSCSEVMSVFEFFLKSKTSMGNLTRHRVEAISSRQATLDTSIVSGKITILSGRAGTGKTIRLLQFAHMQASAGKKCIFLTYNHALVSDIQRLIAFSDYSKEEYENISIQTMYHFFSDILKHYQIDSTYVEENFEEIYEARLRELYSKVQKEEYENEWDYVLVDEAQDWSPIEVSILTSIFRPEQIVIADGVDQFVRTSLNACSWHNSNSSQVVYTQSLRQKSNLVSFVNAFAESAGLINWKIDANSNLRGGRVIVTSKINKNLLDEVKNECLAQHNAMYDILFLAESTIGSPAIMNKLLPEWRKLGFPLFDGTQKDNREYYSIDVEEARIFHYNSCRGIEGWAVVCLYLDMLVDEKLKNMTFPPLRVGETEYDRQVMIWKQICLWILIPLTRAINTLVISLRNPNSKLGQLLHDLSQQHDYIEWRI